MLAYRPSINLRFIALYISKSRHGRRPSLLPPQPFEARQLWHRGDVSLPPPLYQKKSDGCSSTTKNPEDVVVTLAIRTPLTKGFKGGFKDTSLDYIVYSVLKQLVERSQIDPALIEDVCLGNVRPLPHLQIRNHAN